MIKKVKAYLCQDVEWPEKYQNIVGFTIFTIILVLLVPTLGLFLIQPMMHLWCDSMGSVIDAVIWLHEHYLFL